MAWIFWQPAKPTNLTGTLVAGGELAPNTTYYFRVYAWDAGNTTTTRNTLSQYGSIQVYSPYSEVFSITTDDVNKSVALSWDKVYKRNGITEVDAYEVAMSTSDNFLTAQDDALLYPGNVDYYTPATNTNSFTVTKVPHSVVGYQKNIKNGIPLCSWDGATPSCTFKSLYDALAADPYYNIFAKKITSFNDPNNVLGYEFLASIIINRHSGDSAAGVYTFVSIGDLVINFGSFNCSNCKYNVRNSYLFFCGTSHAGGMNVFGNPVAGSFLLNTLLRYTLGTTTRGKSWGSMGQNYAPFVSPNVTTSNNIYQNWVQTAEQISIPTNLTSMSIYNRQFDSSAQVLVSHPQGDGGITWIPYFTILASGGNKRVFMSDRYTWPAYNSRFFGYDMTNNTQEYFQSGQANYIDCIWHWRNFTGIADSDGWNPKISTSSYYGPNLKNSLFYIAKTIKVKVLDKNGNPLSGAKVKFESATGTNLTRANSLDGVCRVGAPARSVGNNFDATETTIKHDQSTIWLKENINSSFGGNIGLPTIGQTYWYGTEKLTLLSRNPTGETWDVNSHAYTVTRGVDGTPSGWILSGNAAYDQRLMTAPDYLITNGSGITYNMTPFRTYKLINNCLDKSNFIDNYVALNNAALYSWSPIKVIISYPGKQDKVYHISESYAISLGVEYINLEVNMDDQVSVYTLIGDDVKLVSNASPSNPQNKILLDVID